MPRRARIVLPHHPHHVVQRGHNRQAVFTEDRDYQYYLANLVKVKAELLCRIHAYCLMPNHVHLIINPESDAENLGILMQRVASRQTRYANKKRRRSGTLWEGRYRSSPIQTERYLLACCRYVELNPLRAGIVEAPWEFRWSSLRKKVGMERKGWIDLDSRYLELGATNRERQSKYLRLILAGLTGEESEVIRRAIHRGRLTGDENFIGKVSGKIGHYAGPRDRGRPQKITLSRL